MGCGAVGLVQLVGFVVVVIPVGVLGLAGCDGCGTLELVQMLGCCCFFSAWVLLDGGDNRFNNGQYVLVCFLGCCGWVLGGLVSSLCFGCCCVLRVGLVLHFILCVGMEWWCCSGMFV